MVSTSPSKKEDVAAAGVNIPNKRSIPFLPGPKLLGNYRFYLDVKNHITSSKLEAKIKELGGVLELFLVREVTHCVTDKEAWANSSKGGWSTPRTPQTPANPSSVNNEHGTPDRTPKRGRPKTRADAMLERACKTPTVVAKDPLEQAKSWGITIWTLEKAFTWLDKVLTLKSSERRKPKVRQLKAPYVKYESFDRKHRPVFSEIRNWPTFNLRAPAGSAGLVHKAAPERNMTRKPRPPQPRIDATAQPGYCEVCRAEYLRLDEHIDSKKHQAFIKDNANFLELDSLINDGADIASFLKLNNGGKCNGIDSPLCSPLPHKMPRTRTSSLCDKAKNTPLSPKNSSETNRLRTRRAAMTNSYIGNTADDDTPIKPEGARQVRELRSTHRNALLKIAEQESDTWSSGRPKRSCIRQKRISVDDNVISENRGYYKIELPDNIEDDEEYEEDEDDDGDDEEEKVVKKPNTSVPVATPADDKSLVVKFRRMRTSELKRLNNEAENFLFPRKDDSSSEDDVDADGPDTTVSTVKDQSTILLSSETEKSEDDDEEDEDEEEEPDDDDDADYSEGSVSSNRKRRRRRRTQAEAFIMDNKKYYKFETPGSRLRYHGSFMANIPPIKPPRNNGSAIKGEELKQKLEVEVPDDTKFSLADLKFSFETVPKSEPWYQTFSRQDQGEEYYTCFSDSGYWKPFLMPYELDEIPPLDPKICISAYTQVKKQIMDEITSGSNSASCSTSNSCSHGSLTPDIQEDDSKASEDASVSSQDDSNSALVRRRRRRKGILLPSKNPRKSPRQHASTLAILSSLIHQRKKREYNKAVKARASLEPIIETETPLEGENITASREHELLAKSIDDMLRAPDLDEYDEVEISYDENLPDMRCKSDAIEILEDYESFKHVEKKTGLASLKRKCFSPGKKPGRKKKKNRTGWPNRAVRRSRKTPEDESTIGSVSDLNEDSNLTEINVPSVCERIVSVVNKTDQSTDKSVNNKASELKNVQNSEDRVKNISEKSERWDNAEKVLAAKVANDVNKDLQFSLQPYVRVQKMDTEGLKAGHRRLRSSSSPHRTNIKRPRRMPASPKSPRILRKPRGRWYRER